MAHGTVEDSGEFAHGARPPDALGPGLLLVSSGEPRCTALPLVDGALALGRDELTALGVHDPRVSRKHLEVRRAAAGWRVRDAGSTNGVFVDGEPLGARGEFAAPRVVRIGRTVLVFADELGAYARSGVRVAGGAVAGPALQEIIARGSALVRAGGSPLLLGETGAGKEVVARAIHAGGPFPRGPFVGVNCATITRDLAERLLFGTRRGAYSGAVADAAGLVMAASGGTLFLDEIGEMDLATQAKLLRVLETREVTPLGATRPEPVDLRLCAATLRDLRADVAAGRFREDLYFRVARPELRLPAMRERLEEIPWLVARFLDEPGSETGPRAQPLVAGARLLERCLLARWPGNVRELGAELRVAGLAARAAGRGVVAVGDLDPRAGLALSSTDGASTALEPAPSELDRGAIARALSAEDGNVTRAAKRLGMPRTSLRRALARAGIRAATDSSDDAGDTT